MATLYIVIWHGSTVYLIGSHDFILSWAWVCPPRWDNYYFADGTSRFLVPGLTCSKHRWRLLMYFGHQILFWPHTLGGICYNPKLQQTCLPGIRPSQILSLPKHCWTTLLKNPFYKDPCALLHYCTHVHASWPKKAHVYLQKNGKRKVVDGAHNFG